MSYNKRETRRCRNFHDDGEPIGRGCVRSNCQFLHPTDPAWAQAQPSRRRNSDVNYNQSSQKPDSGWGSRSGGPSSKPPSIASKDWDSSLWDSPSKKKTDDNSTTNRWGSQSSSKKDATAASPTSTSVSNDWNMTTTGKGESSTEAGWGNTDLPSTWGADITSAWGSGDTIGAWGGGGSTSAWGSGDTGGGWGGGGGGSTSTWGGGDTGGGRGGSGSDGWGGGKTADNTSVNDQKGKGKGKEKGEDVEMSDPLPPKTVGSLKPIIPPSNCKPESAPPPVPNAQNTLPPSAVASKPARPIPLPIPSKQKKASYEDGNLMKLALLSVKNKENEQVRENTNSPSFHGPKGRAELFSQGLRHVSTVVFLYVELQHAQRELARWKRTQESAQYERASHSTRIILDRYRAMFNARVLEAKRRLDRALSALVDLPDFAKENRKNQVPMLTKETIAAYTAELKDWFADIEQHKRILMEREKEKAGLPLGAEGSIEPQLTARQLLDRDKWSWNDITNATNELDSRISTASEHLYSDVYTTIADFKEQAASLQDPRPINLTTTPKETQLDVVSSTTTLVGETISTQINQVAELISKTHALEKEQEQLENEIRAMDKFCAEAVVQFSQFEQWKQIDEARIQQLNEQLQTLHLQYKPPPKTSSSVPTLPPAQLDGMILELRPIVVDHLKNEVQPIFDALRNRFLENLEGLKNLIEERVTPVQVMTDDICHRVSTLS